MTLFEHQMHFVWFLRVEYKALLYSEVIFVTLRNTAFGMRFDELRTSLGNNPLCSSGGPLLECLPSKTHTVFVLENAGKVRKTDYDICFR
jgi:hypothetical protein